MKKRRIKLIVLRTLKRLGLLCKPEPKDPYIKVSSVMYPDGTRTILSGKVRRDEIVNEKSFESELHVWKEVRKKPATRKRVSTKK
jgi:hypothetical protein